MKKNSKSILIFGIFALFLISASFVSAQVNLESKLSPVYNLGDTIQFNISVTPNNSSEGSFSIYLSCPNGKTEVYKDYLLTGSNFNKQINIPLKYNFIGNLTGECKITYSLSGANYTLSNNFKVSDLINLNLNKESVYSPGKVVSMNGTAIKEDQKPVNGELTVKIDGNNGSSVLAKIENGKFSFSFPISENYKSGLHNVSLYAYEKDDSGRITNNAKLLDFFNVGQVPTNLDIVLDNSTIVPGNSLKGKVYLRDQGGDMMNSTAYVAIKNSAGDIIDKINVKTGEEFSYPINYNQAPETGEVAAYSQNIISRIPFTILKNEKVSFSLVNKTLTEENTGNVYYNKTINLTIGNESISLTPSLAVGASEKYLLTAPKGEYKVNVGGVEKTVLLTGNAIKIQKISESKISFIKIIVWIFIIIILGFAAYFSYKRARKKKVFAFSQKRKAKKPLELKQIPKEPGITSPKINADLSLSISGTKQNSPVGCINLKNYDELKKLDGGVKETFEKITTLIESEKGVIYENKGNIFYILPPVLTRTFQNEIKILNISEEIKQILEEHNKKFRQKVNFGVGLGFGVIVTSTKDGSFRFMSMGNLMGQTRKLSLASSGGILMSQKFSSRLTSEIKRRKVDVNGTEAYRMEGIINKSDHSTFIRGFLERQKREENKDKK